MAVGHWDRLCFSSATVQSGVCFVEIVAVRWRSWFTACCLLRWFDVRCWRM